MKTSLLKVFSLTVIITICSAFAAFGQVPSGARDIKPDTSGEVKINQVLKDAGVAFNEALLNLQDNRRSQAREKFDKSVEVFLMSNVNVRSNKKLGDCYDKLVDTIYRIEFPSTQKPDISYLSVTCGWDIKSELANNIVKMGQTPAANTSAGTTSGSQDDMIKSVVPNQNDVAQNGFSQQKFEASPLDELAKLELTPEEQDVVNTPEGRMEYEKITMAVNGGSLGFKFQMDPRVQQFIGYYQGRGRATMETGLYRSGMFTRMARRIFRENGVPENVVWLGQVESAWKPIALSSAAASGLWQFIPGTGARFGLRRTGYVDERNSFEKATAASAQYLKFLANRYGGNWELAMAAYNSGEGNVDRAIRRAGVSSFWAAYPYLPQETRNYVPNILAVILIANNPMRYGFGQIRPAPQLQYETMRVAGSTSLSFVASAANTTVDYLRYLNPELRTNSTPPETYTLRVPMGRANNVLAVMKKMPGANRNSASITTVAAGESWQNISNRTGASVAELQALNGNKIPPKGAVVVPTTANNSVKRTVYSGPANVTPAAAPKVSVVKAKAGDTVASIAARYGIRAIDLARHNGLSGIDTPIAAGRELKIPPR